MNDTALRVGGLVGVITGGAVATAFRMFGAGFWACAAVFLILGWFFGAPAYAVSADAVDARGEPREGRPADEPFIGGLPSVPDQERRVGWLR